MSLFESARFVTSVAEFGELAAAPLEMLPEVAFVGRSNSGKSSVINVLANRRQLAFSSKTPGRTQMLNFFELTGAEGDRRVACAYLVDLPGYGFARADARQRASWDELAGGYLRARRCLACVVLVMDARRPFLPADESLLAWIAGRAEPHDVRVVLLLNKADQLGRADRAQLVRHAEARAQTLPFAASALPFSALKRDGIDALRELLAANLSDARRRNSPRIIARV